MVFSSTVVRITAEAVELSVAGADGEERMVLPNDDVFVLAGGTPPFGMLAECGVSFDPARVQSAAPPTDEGPGLLPALRVALGLATGALVWALLFRSYYGLPASARTTSGLHRLLRPSAGAGLGFGIAAAGLVVVNLAYLARRSARVALNLGSLRTWMTAHVVTGILALVLACLHAAFDPRQTVGGHALLLMVLLVATGAVGRYFYALVPRAANGRELQLDEVRSRIAGLSSEWDRYNRDFGERVRREVQALTSGERWRGSLPRRIWALLRSQSHLRSTLARLRALGRREGVPRRELDAVLLLARRAQRNALMAAHFEDLRGLLATWRYVHRWSGLLLVLLVLLHVVTALRFGGLLD